MTKYWQIVSAGDSVFGTYSSEEVAVETARLLNEQYQSADFRVIVRSLDD